jgi:hypothetical protein
MVTMAGLQVFIVRFFFQGARKGECRCVFRGGERGSGLIMNRVCVRYCDVLRSGLRCGREKKGEYQKQACALGLDGAMMI